jgi:hypothetical protein
MVGGSYSVLRERKGDDNDENNLNRFNIQNDGEVTGDNEGENVINNESECLNCILRAEDDPGQSPARSRQSFDRRDHFPPKMRYRFPPLSIFLHIIFD